MTKLRYYHVLKKTTDWRKKEKFLADGGNQLSEVCIKFHIFDALFFLKVNNT
jgi:hypothetical protein